MAKKIKFNLICDDKPIRTIEDLQNNFSIEDVLSYYNNGLLQRWLDVRGFNSELDEVNKITAKDPVDIIKELIRIFDISADESEIEKSVYILNYLEERRELCQLYEEQHYKSENIIDAHFAGFDELVRQISEMPNDAATIKAAIAEMSENYMRLFAMNHRKLFYDLYKASPLAIMCLLMNDKTRGYYLPNDADADSDSEGIDTSDKEEIYQKICSLISHSDFAEQLGDNLRSFSGETSGYWKDLVEKDKKCMIIKIGIGDFVRSSGVMGGDLGYIDVNRKFVILNGIDYKSQSAKNDLLYMEV